MTKRWLALLAFLLATPAFAGPTQPAQINGGVYNATPPTLSTGQSGVFQFDTNANLKVNCITGCSGGGGGGGTSSEFNAAFPTDGTAAGMKSGANMVPLTSTDGTSLDVKTIGTTTVSGTVTANLGTLNGAATAANQSTEITALGTINTTLGSPLQAGGNIGTVTAVTGITNPVTLSALPAGTALIGKVGIDQTTPGTTNGVQVNAALPAGTNLIGKTGIDQTTPGTTNAVAPISGQAGVAGGSGNVSATTQRVVLATDVALPAGTNALGFVSLSAPTTGGCTPLHTLSAASTNATNVKSSAGTLCSFTAINTTATLYYLKFYNTSSSPTCNSSTVVSTFPVPASTSGAGVTIDLGPYGFAFSTGISFCLTGGLADNDNTNAATGVALSYSYK